MDLLADVPDAVSPHIFGGNGATIMALLALAVACGVLSLIVLWRRWAFLGEGVAHAGFGGAGTAWFLAAIWPAMDRPGVVELLVVIACLGTALAIGAVHRSGKLHADTAIGAFLAGTLAWGFLGQQVYANAYHKAPAGFTALLFGQTQLLDWTQAQLAIAVFALCAAALVIFRRQILLYCFDPDLAQTSGIRTTAVHYLLILLVAAAIICGVRLIGTVLITAMLILPGATARLFTARLYPSIGLAASLSAFATLAGVAVSARWPQLPSGALIVLCLFSIFLGSWVLTRRHPQ